MKDVLHRHTPAQQKSACKAFPAHLFTADRSLELMSLKQADQTKHVFSLHRKLPSMLLVNQSDLPELSPS